MKYLILKTKPGNGFCRVRTIKNVPREHRLSTGESCVAGFPEDALFKMNDSFPKDIRLADSISNLNSLLVVSERFKAALESVPGALLQNEVLPVKIVNHRGRTEKAPYFIIHSLSHPPCIDEAKSKGERSSIDPSQYQFMKKMVIDPSRVVPKELMLFRAAQYPALALVRSDLADDLRKRELTGFDLHEIDKYEF
jgi:hypothetical protein